MMNLVTSYGNMQSINCTKLGRNGVLLHKTSLLKKRPLFSLTVTVSNFVSLFYMSSSPH